MHTRGGFKRRSDIYEEDVIIHTVIVRSSYDDNFVIFDKREPGVIYCALTPAIFLVQYVV